MIETGHFEYSAQYWRNLHSSNDGHWFQVEYALAMGSYIAEHAPNSIDGGNNQFNVANYWLSGCNTEKYESGHQENMDLLSDLVGTTGCHPREDQVMRYYGYFAANTSVPLEEKTAFAYKRGSTFFRQKEYSRAAGWYAVVVTLDSIGTHSLGGMDAMDYLRSYWHPGMSITDVLTMYPSARTNVSASRDSIESKAKLKLINDAGITQISTI
jgi:hypothetical protein